ncbi:hypothetical protein CBR_g51380 [Chara braunii]|uniref:50S ribosomal protein L19 n=1 Tax=Chara braunii TaxID=69332 RepID=A0A388M8G2_CHABU|nr:hypothetical protein CBR_g51380 [Chara braunii]|eukprot:GBG90874.1 hypothetical protein CBR_g51380 [Chara braunii]
MNRASRAMAAFSVQLLRGAMAGCSKMPASSVHLEVGSLAEVKQSTSSISSARLSSAFAIPCWRRLVSTMTPGRSFSERLPEQQRETRLCSRTFTMSVTSASHDGKALEVSSSRQGSSLGAMPRADTALDAAHTSSGIMELLSSSKAVDGDSNRAPIWHHVKTKALTKQAQHIMNILNAESVAVAKQRIEYPDFRPGDVLQLKVEIPENHRRIAVIRGVCIARRNSGIGSTFRLRRVLNGQGIEHVYPLLEGEVAAQQEEEQDGNEGEKSNGEDKEMDKQTGKEQQIMGNAEDELRDESVGKVDTDQEDLQEVDEGDDKEGEGVGQERVEEENEEEVGGRGGQKWRAQTVSRRIRRKKSGESATPQALNSPVYEIPTLIEIGTSHTGERGRSTPTGWKSSMPAPEGSKRKRNGGRSAQGGSRAEGMARGRHSQMGQVYEGDLDIGANVSEILRYTGHVESNAGNAGNGSSLR